MHKKIFAVCLFAILFVLAWSLSPVFAKNPDNNGWADREIPEEEGTYDVPGHPNLKVRVFIHRPGRPPKPTPTPPAPVCNLEDPNSTSDVSAAGWHIPSSSWTYNLNLNSVPASVGSGNLALMSADAFSRWSFAIDGTVTFTEGPNTAANRAVYDGQNIIAWGRAPGGALAVAYIWYYQDTGELVEVDTIMNKKYSWSWTPYNEGNLCSVAGTYDAQDILTHELGHWVGLDDHYTDDYKENTMYGYGGTAEVKKDTLTTGDINGAAEIY